MSQNLHVIPVIWNQEAESFYSRLARYLHAYLGETEKMSLYTREKFQRVSGC